MKLHISFDIIPRDIKTINTSDVEYLENKYNFTVSTSISQNEINDLWQTHHEMFIDCPDHTSINSIVRDLYNLFGGDHWHISMDLDDPDKLMQITQAPEDNSKQDYVTIEKVSCRGNAGTLVDDLRFLSKQLMKHYDPSDLVKIEGSRRIPINPMDHKPMESLCYNISIEN